MSVSPDVIAVALGVATPASNSPQALQWALWIEDAEMLIETRRLEVDETLVLDPVKLDYVIRQAVVAHALRPDDSAQVSVTSDATTIAKTYRAGGGRVSILDEWWTLLGLQTRTSGAFSITPTYSGSLHLPWCSLMFGATYCSCGVDIAGRPIFEAG